MQPRKQLYCQTKKKMIASYEDIFSVGPTINSSLGLFHQSTTSTKLFSLVFGRSNR